MPSSGRPARARGRAWADRTAGKSYRLDLVIAQLAASSHFGPRLGEICASAPGAVAAGWLPVGALAETSGGSGSPYAGPASTGHIMGTARMGNDPATSVVDRWDRMHELENVYVADGSVFVSSGGFNPTLTIMALSLRMARHLARG